MSGEMKTHSRCEACGSMPGMEDTLRAKLREMDGLFDSLLNMVNAVTAKHRHGQAINYRHFDNLSNRQLDVENRRLEIMKDA